MTSKTDEGNGGTSPSGAPQKDYGEHRRDKKAERKAARAAKRAAKPKGIDLPFRKAMPRGLLIAFGVAAVLTLALVVIVLVNPPAAKIAIAERRSPPSATLSHDVGSIVLAPIPDPLPDTAVPCEPMRGVVIEGGPPAQERLGGVLDRLCPHAAGNSPLAQSIRALSGARIRFGVFTRSGNFSTLSVPDPTRVLISIRFAQRDVSAALIGPFLVHEGFHLLHRGEPMTAELEYEARVVESEACRLLIEIQAWDRGCTDAQSLVEFGRDRAIEELVAAGFARGA